MLEADQEVLDVGCDCTLIELREPDIIAEAIRLEVAVAAAADLRDVACDGLGGDFSFWEHGSNRLNDANLVDSAATDAVDVACLLALIVSQEGHYCADRFRRSVEGDVERIPRHAGIADRANGIDLNADFLPFDRQYPRQANEPGLGGTIVGLAELAEEAGSGGGEDDAAGALCAHELPGWKRDVKSSVEMNIEDRVDHGLVHLVERLVPQDAGVVDQYVNPTEGVDCSLHDGRSTLPGGYAVVVGNGAAAEGDDLVDDPLGRGFRSAAAVDAAANVVDDHIGTALTKLERVGAAETASCTGDDDDEAIEPEFR